LKGERPEYRTKMSLMMRGRQVSPETLAKMKVSQNSENCRLLKSQRHKGKSHSPESKEKMIIAKMKLCTVDGITIYRNSSELRLHLGKGVSGAKSPNFRYIQLAIEWVPHGPFCPTIAAI